MLRTLGAIVMAFVYLASPAQAGGDTYTMPADAVVIAVPAEPVQGAYIEPVGGYAPAEPAPAAPTQEAYVEPIGGYAPAETADTTISQCGTVMAEPAPAAVPCPAALEPLPTVATGDFVISQSCTPGTVCPLAPAKSMCERAIEVRPHLETCICEIITSHELRYPENVAVFSCQNQTVKVREVVKWRTQYRDRVIEKKVFVDRPVDRPVYVQPPAPQTRSRVVCGDVALGGGVIQSQIPASTSFQLELNCGTSCGGSRTIIVGGNEISAATSLTSGGRTRICRVVQF